MSDNRTWLKLKSEYHIERERGTKKKITMALAVYYAAVST